MSNKEIDDLLNQAYALIAEAEGIADLAGESFDFELSYGMGGTYYPKRMSKQDALAVLRSGKELSDEERKGIARILDNNDDDYYGTGWVSSSAQC